MTIGWSKTESIWKVLEIWEQPIKCGARRGRHSKVFCEVPALHVQSCGPMGAIHSGRGRLGQWFFWADPSQPDARGIPEVCWDDWTNKPETEEEIEQYNNPEEY